MCGKRTREPQSIPASPDADEPTPSPSQSLPLSLASPPSTTALVVFVLFCATKRETFYMVAHLTDEEVNAQLAAMMADDDELMPPLQTQFASSATISGRTPPANPALPANLDDEELLRRAMDDDWDGAAARSNPVPSIGNFEVSVSASTSANSMGYLRMPDAAAALLAGGGLPGAPPADTKDSSYCLPSLDDHDEFMFPASGSDLGDPEDILAKTNAALAALAASDVQSALASAAAGGEIDGAEQWQGLACDIFQDAPLVPVGCVQFELPLGADRRSVVVHPKRSAFERAGAAAAGAADSGAAAAAGTCAGGGAASGVGADAARMTGALLWDSAVVLALHLASRHHQQHLPSGQVAPTRCIELGAGLGLPGLTAARLGLQTTLTDRAECLPLLTNGVSSNGLQSTAEVRELLWGAQTASHDLGTFDLILASDCIYEETVVPSLVATLAALVKPDGTSEILIAYDEAIGRPRAAEAFRACVESTRLDSVRRFVWEELPPSTDASRSKACVHLVRLTVRPTPSQ